MQQPEIMAALDHALKVKDVAQIETLAKEAIEKFPEEAFGYAYWGEAFLLSDAPIYSQVESCFSTALSIDSSNIDYWSKYAYAQEQNGVFEKAAGAYGNILNLDSENIQALISLGLYETRYTKAFDNALEFFNAALRIDGTNVQTFIYRAEAYAGQENYEAALVDLDYALFDFFDHAAIALKIDICKKLQKYDEVENLYNSLISDTPDNFAYLYDYGVFLSERGNYIEAEDYLSKALDIYILSQDFSTIVYLPYAKVLNFNQKYAEALAVCDDCIINAEKEDMELYLLRSEIKTALKDFDGAMSDINTVMKLSGSDDFFKDIMREPKAIILLEMGKVDMAKKEFTLLSQNPMLYELGQYGLALVELKENNFPQAYAHALNAKNKRHPKAASLLKTKFAAYLANLKQTLLANAAADFEKNMASPALNLAFNQYWVFDSLKSTFLQNLPEEAKAVIENINKTFATALIYIDNQDFIMSFAEGIFINGSNDFIAQHIPTGKELKAADFIYKVEKEKEGLVQVRLISLDATSEDTILKLKIDKNTLIVSKKEGEFLKFKRVPLSAVSTEAKSLFKANFEDADWSHCQSVLQNNIKGLK
jgi:tetratricopeptide (TPR) repeat protein